MDYGQRIQLHEWKAIFINGVATKIGLQAKRHENRAMTSTAIGVYGIAPQSCSGFVTTVAIVLFEVAESVIVC